MRLPHYHYIPFNKCLTNQTKSSSQISERTIKVIRGLSLCEAFSLPPRAIIEKKQIGIMLAHMPFFVLRRRLRKRAFDAPPYHKKSHNQRLRDLLLFVIRLRK